MNMRLIIFLPLLMGTAHADAMEQQAGKATETGAEKYAPISLDQVLGCFGSKAWEQERMKQVAAQEQEEQERQAALAATQHMAKKYQPLTLDQTIGPLNGSSNQQNELSQKEKETVTKALELYCLQYKLGCGTYVPVFTKD